MRRPILAARENRPVLTMEDLNEALMKITAGPAKKSRVQTRKDLKETAIHEAGHAVAMYNLPTHTIRCGTSPSSPGDSPWAPPGIFLRTILRT